MSEILLQTIVEKLESLEIASLKQSDPGKDETLQKQIFQSFKSLQSEFQIIISQLNNNSEKLNSFSREINALALKIDYDSPRKVKHIHHFHKLVWITVSLFLISLLLAYGWINCYKEKRIFEANDIKYRYWKVDRNAALLKLTDYTDSLYDLDKEGFKKQVQNSEDQY